MMAEIFFKSKHHARKTFSVINSERADSNLWFSFSSTHTGRRITCLYTASGNHPAEAPSLTQALAAPMTKAAPCAARPPRTPRGVPAAFTEQHVHHKTTKTGSYMATEILLCCWEHTS